ncbi:hypothetical protein E2320_000632, partial [Naja naja]
DKILSQLCWLFSLHTYSIWKVLFPNLLPSAFILQIIIVQGKNHSTRRFRVSKSWNTSKVTVETPLPLHQDVVLPYLQCADGILEYQLTFDGAQHRLLESIFCCYWDIPQWAMAVLHEHWVTRKPMLCSTRAFLIMASLAALALHFFLIATFLPSVCGVLGKPLFASVTAFVAGLFILIALAVYTAETWNEKVPHDIQVSFAWSFYLGWITFPLFLLAGIFNHVASLNAQSSSYERM